MIRITILSDRVRADFVDGQARNRRQTFSLDRFYEILAHLEAAGGSDDRFALTAGTLSMRSPRLMWRKRILVQ
jgi:hypothetical protein